jgi:signal transduction histidine kinase
MGLLPGFLLAGALTHAVLAAFVGSTPRRRRPRFLTLWLGSLALADLAQAAPYLIGDAARFAPSMAAARAASALLLALFFLAYEQRPTRRGVERGLLVGAAVSVAAAVAHMVAPVSSAGAGYVGRGVVAASAMGSSVGVAIALSVCAKALLRSGRSSPAMFLGLTAVAAATIHDVVGDVGWLHGAALSPFAYDALLIATLGSLLGLREAEHRRLSARAAELTSKEHDLVLAYEELSQAQSELVRKEQLAAVGELSAVIAHEIRNPLAIMSNAVATLRREGLGADDRATLLAILEEESSRLNRIVGDLLRYARPVRVERHAVQLRELVARAVALAHARPDVRIEISEPHPLGRIMADPNLLRQVVENLVSNAIQAMQAGGVLTLRIAAADVDGEPGVELQIEDTGEGMDTAVRNRAVDPFFTTRPSGTGLGLAIVARIVDAHGGRIRITSAAGAGTVVHVYLPISGESKRSRSSDPGRTSSVPPLLIEARKAIGDGRA